MEIKRAEARNVQRFFREGAAPFYPPARTLLTTGASDHHPVECFGPR
jgi:hypothetical protein